VSRKRKLEFVVIKEENKEDDCDVEVVDAKGEQENLQGLLRLKWIFKIECMIKIRITKRLSELSKSPYIVISRLSKPLISLLQKSLMMWRVRKNL
jgi:hypothetical protein